MNALVVGSGGREHALAWKLSQTLSRKELFATPGNPGMAQIATCVPSVDSSPQNLLAIAESVGADLAIVGPEAPLVAGVVDAFRAAGRAIIGPTAEAARLEGSKVYAKDLFRRLSVPTAEYVTVENAEDARRQLDRFGYPLVLKADGLAAGKGVVIAQDRAEAEQALKVLTGRLVIEEYLAGEEVSFIVLTDGKTAIPLEPTQDHKAINDGDAGPNTGGMGAYSDSRILTQAESEKILDTVIRPAIEVTGFTGFLYAGLMMTSSGPKVLEFNVRLGDPETQPLMLRLDADLGSLLESAAHGSLKDMKLTWKPDPAVCVVLASAGYPGSYRTGVPIDGVSRAGETVFHAGTRLGAQGLETAGGRVLGVTASGNDLASAIDKAYAAVRKIHFDGMHYRTDIGRKGLRRYNVGVPGT
jgi:phosphoribosylamine---glycine ligase